MALTEDKYLPFIEGDNAIPAGGDVEVFRNSMISICEDSDPGIGYGNALVAGELFVGHAREAVDNTGGEDGALDIPVRVGRYRLKVDIAGAVITDEGKEVYASDDGTVTLTVGTNSKVGRITRFVSSGVCEVEFRPFES